MTHLAGWLPPAESWVASALGDLPYGWEQATDHRSRPYYINHLNKTTTYEAPLVRHDGLSGNTDIDNDSEPRTVILRRDPDLGFGFVAGSEKPVIVRFVTKDGPSVGKLEPGDQILKVNGEEVETASRDHVIELVRACVHSVTLEVRQPPSNGVPGRRSALLTRTARERLRARPKAPRVRFADSVCVNGAPLFPASAFSLGDLCLPPMANVLKVFLENGQTKSFKYDSSTTVQDVVTSLKDKLCLSAVEHFSLVVEHVKSLRRNKLTLLDPKETLVRIASHPGVHKLRCLFRVSFVPLSAAELAQKDLNSMDYLYMQCCNDVAQERFAPELQPDVALRLAALHMHQHALAHNMSPAKLTVKAVEREFGLERFIPCGLLETMKRKELRRLVGHFIKLNAQMTGNQQKYLSQLQAKLHYLDIISSLPSYGAKCFTSNQPERVLLVSPRFGLSQIAGIRNSVPTLISNLEDLMGIRLVREDELTYNVTIFLQRDRVLTCSMEDRDGAELALVLSGYYRLITGKEFEVDQEREPINDDIAPPYLSQHNVVPAKWSYLNFDDPTVLSKSHYMTFTMPPPYHSTPKLTYNGLGLDTNMNSTLVNKNHSYLSENSFILYDRKNGKITNSIYENHQENDENDEYGRKESLWLENNFSPDFQNILSLEMYENNTNSKFIEAKNEEVLKRVAEMQKVVENSERYLSEQGELIYKDHSLLKDNNSYRFGTTTDKLESDNESAISKISMDDVPGKLKHSDSLILLTESINKELNGINNDLNTILTTNKNIKDTLTLRQSQGLSAILNNCGLTDALLALNIDLSQSESDNDSLYTPTSSPIHKHHLKNNNQNKIIRTSFGLHSPDSSQGNKEQNLREYLNQLRENSNNIYNITNDIIEDNSSCDIHENSLFNGNIMNIIDLDPNLIDLTLLPPPPTPDELDNISQVSPLITTVPPSFADENILKNEQSILHNKSIEKNNSSLDDFLATVVVEPPTLKVTPAIELTPEEIMSFIIPPPPVSNESNNENISTHSNETQLVNRLNNLEKPLKSNAQIIKGNVSVSEIREIFNAKSLSQARNSLTLNEKNIEKNNLYDLSKSPNSKRKVSLPSKNSHPSSHIIDYPTVERKSVFSCCTKENKTKEYSDQENSENDNEKTLCELKLPPRPIKDETKPPERPPKNISIDSLARPRSNSFSHSNSEFSVVESFENRFNTLNNKKLNYDIVCMQNNVKSQLTNGCDIDTPPILPPRGEVHSNIPLHILLPPKKPPLPPVPSIETLKMRTSLKNSHTLLKSNNEPRVASIGSPHFVRNSNFLKDLEGEHQNNSSNFNPNEQLKALQLDNATQNSTLLRTMTLQSKIGHVRSHSETKNTILKNKEMSTIFSLCSPQMNRKFTNSPTNETLQVNEKCSPSFTRLDCKSKDSVISDKQGSSNFTMNTNNNANKIQNDLINTTLQKIDDSGIGGNGHIISIEILFQKTEIAVDGLLYRLHEVAQTCSHQHAHGGGEDINEQKFQEAREQLTNEAVALVTASRSFVAALASGVLRNVAGPLAECLTPLKRLTDLSQALGRHTSSPLQTRNLVLRVHDVTAAFKELAGIDMAKIVKEYNNKTSNINHEAGSSLEGQLALRAECLANVLATLLRSLRVFSP